MKKLLICLIVICTLLFSGCSCSKKQVLNFDTNWLNSTKSFQRTYNVSLADYSDGTNSFKYDKKDKYGDIEINGKYIAKFYSCNQAEIKDLVSEKFYGTLTGDNLYVLETTLSLKTKYKIAGNETYDDFIKTKSYFFGKNLLPIFSESENSTSYIGFDGEKPVITQINGKDTVTYDIDSYKITRNATEKASGKTFNEENEYDYEKGTVIDNSILLFALENYNVEKDASKSLNVISTTYGEDKELMVRCYNVLSKMPNTSYQNVKVESFILNPENPGCFGGNTGRAQVVYLNKTTDSYEIVKYVAPLTSYDNSYNCLGALVYDLENN